jgi:23S rRNA (guanosine2251-2'-O)-methyltransferase
MEKEEKTELIIFGKQPVLEALYSKHKISHIYLAIEMDKRDSVRISELAKKKKVKVVYSKKSELQKICGPVLHQGVAAILDDYLYLDETGLMELLLSERNPFLLILDQIQDPHNLGAIIRTAESAGVTAIILPEKGSASVSPTVAKTSAGAVFHCSIYQTLDLQEMIKNLRDQNVNVVALVPHRDNTIYETDLSGSLAIVVGSEGKGVRKNIQRLCDKSISIPGYGKVDSLNASVSTAVVVFEAVRQRLKRV